MPTTDHPIAACHRDSARVEKRGPSTTTIVPPSTAAQPCPCAAASATLRPSGQYGSANVVCTTFGTVPSGSGSPSKYVCVRDFVRSTSWSGTSSVPGPYSSRSPPTAHGPSTWRTPDRPQRPQVRAVVDPVRRQPVGAPVPGQEGHAAPGHLPEEQGVAGAAVRGADPELGHVLEEGVEAGAADHADLCVRRHAAHPRRGFGRAGRSVRPWAAATARSPPCPGHTEGPAVGNGRALG